MKPGKIIAMCLTGLLLCGCSGTSGTDIGYKQITQEEAAQMMKANDGHIIVDVRREDEYDSGHIPGAVCIPNESIGTEQPEELPDLNQVILIYCRSGNRSKQAAEKLVQIGYTNIYEFGGIMDWKGEIEYGSFSAVTSASGKAS